MSDLPTGTVTPPVTPTPPVAPAQSWFTGLEGMDGDMLAHLQNKGWDRLDAPRAAFEAARSHREVSKFTGVDPNLVVRLPENLTDTAAMRSVYERLGAPKDAAEYKFEGVDFKDPALNGAITEAARAVAFKHGITPLAAQEFLAATAAGVTQSAEAKAQIAAGEGVAAMAALKQSWGANYDAFRFMAQQGVKGLASQMGVEPEKLGAALTALEGHAGADTIWKMFHTIARGMGEGKFITTGGSSGAGALTVEQAQATRMELEADKAWVTRYRTGDVEARKQMAALLQIISSAE